MNLRDSFREEALLDYEKWENQEPFWSKPQQTYKTKKWAFSRFSCKRSTASVNIVPITKFNEILRSVLELWTWFTDWLKNNPYYKGPPCCETNKEYGYPKTVPNIIIITTHLKNLGIYEFAISDQKYGKKGNIICSLNSIGGGIHASSYYLGHHWVSMKVRFSHVKLNIRAYTRKKLYNLVGL